MSDQHPTTSQPSGEGKAPPRDPVATLAAIVADVAKEQEKMRTHIYDTYGNGAGIGPRVLSVERDTERLDRTMSSQQQQPPPPPGIVGIIREGFGVTKDASGEATSNKQFRRMLLLVVIGILGAVLIILAWRSRIDTAVNVGPTVEQQNVRSQRVDRQDVERQQVSPPARERDATDVPSVDNIPPPPAYPYE